MLTLTKAQMLERWMAMRGLGPMRTDAQITRVDGTDVELMMEAQMRRWYVRQLDTAPASLINTREAASEVSAVSLNGGGIEFPLPEDARRIVELRLSGSTREAELTLPGTVTALRQENMMTRGGTAHPVAVLLPQGRVRAYPGGSVTRLLVVSDPGPESYIFDESLFPDGDGFGELD